MRFENKVGIVTGSGGGIGQAYAEALAREGAAVVVADINVEAADAGSDTSTGMLMAVPPSATICLATASAASTIWSTTPRSLAA